MASAERIGFLLSDALPVDDKNELVLQTAGRITNITIAGTLTRHGAQKLGSMCNLVMERGGKGPNDIHYEGCHVYRALLDVRRSMAGSDLYCRNFDTPR